EQNSGNEQAATFLPGSAPAEKFVRASSRPPSQTNPPWLPVQQAAQRPKHVLRVGRAWTPSEPAQDLPRISRAVAPHRLDPCSRTVASLSSLPAGGLRPTRLSAQNGPDRSATRGGSIPRPSAQDGSGSRCHRGQILLPQLDHLAEPFLLDGGACLLEKLILLFDHGPAYRPFPVRVTLQALFERHI